MYTIFTDTDCDFTPETAKEYGYKLISMPFSIDGKTYFPYEDSETFDMPPFYAKLREGVIPTTSGVSIEKYKNYFRPEFEKGNDVMYVHFSRAMSGTFSAMDEAVKELKVLRRRYEGYNDYQLQHRQGNRRYVQKRSDARGNNCVGGQGSSLLFAVFLRRRP